MDCNIKSFSICISRPAKDVYYDIDAEQNDNKIMEMKRKMKAAQTYVKRVITHPSFKNISFKETITLMENMEQGECIIRPSSKVVIYSMLSLEK